MPNKHRKLRLKCPGVRGSSPRCLTGCSVGPWRFTNRAALPYVELLTNGEAFVQGSSSQGSSASGRFSRAVGGSSLLPLEISPGFSVVPEVPLVAQLRRQSMRPQKSEVSYPEVVSAQFCGQLPSGCTGKCMQDPALNGQATQPPLYEGVPASARLRTWKSIVRLQASRKVEYAKC